MASSDPWPMIRCHLRKCWTPRVVFDAEKTSVCPLSQYIFAELSWMLILLAFELWTVRPNIWLLAAFFTRQFLPNLINLASFHIEWPKKVAEVVQSRGQWTSSVRVIDEVVSNSEKVVSNVSSAAVRAADSRSSKFGYDRIGHIDGDLLEILLLTAPSCAEPTELLYWLCLFQAVPLTLTCLTFLASSSGRGGLFRFGSSLFYPIHR